MAVVKFTLFCFIPAINLVAFYKKNNQGKQDIFTALELFSNDSGKSGRNGKSSKYIFEKSGPIVEHFLEKKLTKKSTKSGVRRMLKMR